LQHFAIGHDGVPELSIKTPQEVADTIRAALDTVPPERLYPCTNCGMAPMSSDIAYAKLAALSAGAELARKAVQ
jgi:5-methyltetrahydropteroyltriglutamate--homocysteine methyltransferase